MRQDGGYPELALAPSADAGGLRPGEQTGPVPVPSIRTTGLGRRFGQRSALDDVGLVLTPGEIHALLGPNGAGKTTLLRILSGLVSPTLGRVEVAGIDAAREPQRLRRLVGLVPSGDRTFYLRISGLENLAFFARLHGMRRRDAVSRARVVLDEVGLAEAADTPVGVYSHGMQKRLSVARALLTEPAVLLVDEATHDLDPEGAQRVRSLVEARALQGTTVVWATQRLDEIRGLADGVTLMREGKVRFQGSVAELADRALTRRYVLRLAERPQSDRSLELSSQTALGSLGDIAAAGEGQPGHYLLSLAPDAMLGDAMGALARARVGVLACREERSQLEEAFLTLTQSATS